VAKTVGKTAATVRDIVGSDEPSVGADSTEPSDPISAGPSDSEDAAQASARGEVVSPDELPDHAHGEDHQSEPPAADSAASVEPPDDTQERPDLQELREELNAQFESVKVVAPGQYELNLMELYDREEYIVALEEDGRYSIQVPEPIQE
jgi:predicted  nucleic acid-binding Zn-ribbon protein